MLLLLYVVNCRHWYTSRTRRPPPSAWFPRERLERQAVPLVPLLLLRQPFSVRQMIVALAFAVTLARALSFAVALAVALACLRIR